MRRPLPAGDDIYLYDYSLFFVATLYDYVESSGDLETLRELWPLAEKLGDTEAADGIRSSLDKAAAATLAHLWDAEQGFFVSGEDRQVSWASQVWMALAEVLDRNGNAELLDRLFAVNPDIRPMTPYMYHHLIDALILAGRNDKALEQMRAYWGEMARDGADTFWEVYNPEDKKNSPYGSNLINSYCHAWSCTPTYFIRKYFV